jgi:protein-S-isoprenylcysteine O-methyltransferase Ste14
VTKDRPGVIAPPPLIFLAGLVIGYLGRGLLPRFQSVIGGAVLMLAAFALGAWGVATMAHAKTNVAPYRPTTAIVTRGPFRFTRNPLYVSMTIIYIATALWIGSTFAYLLLPIVLLVVRFGVIAREERYLEAKFGDEYRAYRARVRRWI